MPTDDPHVASAVDLWHAADWHERESRDMFGIVFEGHPNLVPLLLPDDMLDHFPLRKDNPLAPIEEWQGDEPRRRHGPRRPHPAGLRYRSAASAEAE